MAEELQAILGRPVEILPLSSYDAMIDAQVQRRIDGGFYSAAAFAAADSALRLPGAARRAGGRGRDARLSRAIVVRDRLRHRLGRRSRRQDGGDRRGRFDRRPPHATRRPLSEEGIDPGRLRRGARGRIRPRTAVRLVAAGAADAAFAWSSLAGRRGRRLFARHADRARRARRDRDGRARDHLALAADRARPVRGAAQSLPEDGQGQDRGISAGAVERSQPGAYDMLDPFYGGGYAPSIRRTMPGSRRCWRDIDALRCRTARHARRSTRRRAAELRAG